MLYDAEFLAARAWHTAIAGVGVRTLANRLRHGGDAPRPQMRFVIAPESLRKRYLQSGNGGLRIGHWQTGQVLPGDWDHATRAFDVSLKFNACRQHFLNRVPWNHTRAMSYGLERIASQGKYDDCRTKEDLIARYARLDDLWNKTKSAKALPDEAARKTNARSGILVHVDRNGDFLFGNQGFHRLSIAQLAKIPDITVVLGVVHPNAVASGAFAALATKHSA